MKRPATRHVWIRMPNLPYEQQAYLFGWEQSPEGDWVGLVTWVDQANKVVTPTWLPAASIRPERSQARLMGTAYSPK